MKLTSRGRYAVTAMLDLAIHGQRAPVTLSDIAQRQGLSLAYLEQLFARLRRVGLVTGTRGPGGGYRLNRAADDVCLMEVIGAVDGPLDATRCGGRRDCQEDEVCLTHELWADLSAHVAAYLTRTTLGKLSRRRGVLVVAERQLRRTRGSSEAPLRQISWPVS